MTVSDVARILRLKTPRAVRYLIREQIGYVLIGKRLRVRPADLDAYLRRQTHPSIAAHVRRLISPPLPKKATPRRVK